MKPYKNRMERTKFVKKIIFWSVVLGGIVALFIPLLGAGSVQVYAQCNTNSDSTCKDRSPGASCVVVGGGSGTCSGSDGGPCVCQPNEDGGGGIDDIIDPCSLGPCLANIDEADEGVEGLANIVFGFINFFIFVGAAIAVIMIAYGGFQWITGWSLLGSNGEKGGKAGLKTIYYAVLALAALGLVYVIIQIVIGTANILRGTL